MLELDHYEVEFCPVCEMATDHPDLDEVEEYYAGGTVTRKGVHLQFKGTCSPECARILMTVRATVMTGMLAGGRLTYATEWFEELVREALTPTTHFIGGGN